MCRLGQPGQTVTRKDYGHGQPLRDSRLFCEVRNDRVRHNDEGASAVEYGLMVALIAAIIVGIVGTLGGQVQNAFQTVSSQMP